jgi:hypothetical protein
VVINPVRGGKKKKKEGVKGTKGFSLEKMGHKSPHHEGEKKKTSIRHI